MSTSNDTSEESVPALCQTFCLEFNELMVVHQIKSLFCSVLFNLDVGFCVTLASFRS